jgi:cytochrome c oxidase accessory protein FixG
MTVPLEQIVPDAPERVLSTLNRDGSRRWLRPRLSSGVFLRWRRAVAYALMVIFAVLPWLTIRGKPPILLDLPRREFTFFGTTFLPTDTLLLALFLLAVFVTIFLVTALVGRVWCGWGCPQTVYMEFLYRPIERLFEGRNYRSGGKAPIAPWRRLVKYATYLVLSLVVAHTFLAYFVGADDLFRWIRQSPFEHPTAFIVMAVTTGLMMLDFCFLREQVCTLMCPYGRFQSALLDRQSLVIGYDRKRGEPRGPLRRAARDADRAGAPPAGDCIDCGLCVTTCPTGIDIREGLQLECVACAQCVDACDAVMDRVGRPRGLIRYGAQETMETGRRRILRPRVVIYPIILVAVVGLFMVVLARRGPVEAAILRQKGIPYAVLDSGDVEARLQVRLTNRTREARTYTLSIAELDNAPAVAPITVGPGASGEALMHLVLPRSRFARGRAAVTLLIADDRGEVTEVEGQVPGPIFGGAGGGTSP